ncbi:hypothetical protein BDR26DRAFT_896023 [Obelidium mucronatum]|nr:hypothetical protein BDR26DRAFT_896023 [Obelidium mucronatum]
MAAPNPTPAQTNVLTMRFSTLQDDVVRVITSVMGLPVGSTADVVFRALVDHPDNANPRADWDGVFRLNVPVAVIPVQEDPDWEEYTAIRDGNIDNAVVPPLPPPPRRMEGFRATITAARAARAPQQQQQQQPQQQPQQHRPRPRHEPAAADDDPASDNEATSEDEAPTAATPKDTSRLQVRFDMLDESFRATITTLGYSSNADIRQAIEAILNSALIITDMQAFDEYTTAARITDYSIQKSVPPQQTQRFLMDHLKEEPARNSLPTAWAAKIDRYAIQQAKITEASRPTGDRRRNTSWTSNGRHGCNHCRRTNIASHKEQDCRSTCGQNSCTRSQCQPRSKPYDRSNNGGSSRSDRRPTE